MTSSVANASGISTIVTCYRQASLLRDVLPVLLAESSQEDEVIVSDDGSPDGSADQLQAWFGSDSRVRVLHGEPTGSVARTRNRGLAVATRPWITFLDGDDSIVPGRHACFRRGMRAWPTSDVLLTDGFQWKPGTDLSSMRSTQAGSRFRASIEQESGPPADGWRAINAGALVPIVLANRTKVHLGAVAFRASWLRERGLTFDPRFPVSEDTDFLMRSLSGATAAWCTDVTHVYRLGGEGLNGRNDLEAARARVLSRMLMSQLPELQGGLPGGVLWRSIAREEVNLTILLRSERFFATALRYALRSLVASPSRAALREASKSIVQMLLSRTRR